MKLQAPRSLRHRIVLWLLAFAAALTLAIIAQGTVVIEYVERSVWKSMLTVELDHFIQRSQQEPGYHWDDTAGLVLYVGADDPALPPPLRRLEPGLHDDLRIGGSKYVALVQDNAGTRYTLAMDIAQFSSDESIFEWVTVIAALVLLLAVSVAAMFGVSRLLRPLSRLAQRISAVRPGQADGFIALEPGAGSELAVIADAFNDYLQRNAQFVERERTFINTASHELRTPVAVINGAAELALQPGANPATTQLQLQRIQRSAREMEQLIILLLALAKDPARLAAASKPVALDALLPQIVEDHQHLTAGKSLQLHLAPAPACLIHAPSGIVRAAVGNLLRNAIENSDSGCIDIALHADGTLVIRDPGHGMSPEQISEIYTRMARAGGGSGDSGIGLELISRLCEHFGWQLDLQSDPGRGTTATLKFTSQLCRH
ncbi:histidine kinase [Stenotrophomonas koreensis]|uniref:histidine kinase n=1 Tax=Stenotrophomonas koreensis TaxID=266128 RepID=A0A0R0BVK3_9GAMM|nr:HAMP domain-containing sensor histidine kinase [Stenotrophomonas koreensis]KRG57970.1 histidine kinase [Stenotrophomonas koreensis]